MSTSAGSLWGSGRRTASSTLLVILYDRSAQVGDHNISHRSLWPLLLCRHAGRSKHLVHPLPQRLPTLAIDESSVDPQRSSNGLQTIVGSRWGRGRSNCLYVCIKKFPLPPPGELDLLWTPARDQRRTSWVVLHWQLRCLLASP